LGSYYTGSQARPAAVDVQSGSIYQEQLYSLRRWLNSREDAFVSGYNGNNFQDVAISAEELESWMEQHTFSIAALGERILPGELDRILHKSS
jgi:hypothetical protein